jgi:hypothetical protein
MGCNSAGERRDWKSMVVASPAPRHHRHRRRWLLIAGSGVIVTVVFVLVWFQPQKLWVDDRVSEPVPTPTASGAPRGDVMNVPAPAPVEVSGGELVSRDHHTSGVVRVLAFDDGRRIVRLEGLDTSNGPDLYVYLSTNRSDGPEAAFDDEYVSLGRLKGNQGDQNYDVPGGTDLARFTTLVIWCDRFDSAFGAAGLAAT